MTESAMGAQVVRDALNEAAEALADARADMSPEEHRRLAADIRRQLRTTVNASGDSINWGEWKTFARSVDLDSARRDLNRGTHGFDLRRTDAGYALKAKDGQTVFTLPSGVGAAVAKDPERFGPRLMLLEKALAAEDPEAIRDQAAALLHAIAEKEHDAGDGTLAFGTADARAGALVTWLNRRQAATDPEARRQADAAIAMALFAEADPTNRLISFGMDLAPIIGNLRAGEDMLEDGAAALKALEEGRYADAGAASLWTLIDAVGAVSGFHAAAKGGRAALQSTEKGRKVVAAYDVARMAREYRGRRKSISVRAALPKAYWEQLSPDYRRFLGGIYNNVMGQVGEQKLTDTFKNLDFNTINVVNDALKAKGIDPVPVKNTSRWTDLAAKDGGKSRVHDDAIDGYTLKRVMGVFLVPTSAVGKKWKAELKTAGAGRPDKQAAKDRKLLADKQNYGDIEVALLALPYHRLPKKKLAEVAVRLILNPNGAGQKGVKSGRWTKVELEEMAEQIDRQLNKQHLRGEQINLLDFTLAFAARLAIANQEDEG